MSSNTKPCESLNGVIESSQGIQGPLRLPLCGVDEFIAEFNERYATFGWNARPQDNLNASSPDDQSGSKQDPSP
jgi:hypothetical protein